MKRIILYITITISSLAFVACDTCGKGGTNYKFLTVEDIRAVMINSNKLADTITRNTSPNFQIRFEVKGYARQESSFSFFNTAYACSPANMMEYDKNDSMVIIADSDITGVVGFKKNDIINDLILFNSQRTDTQDGVLLKNHLQSGIINVDVLKIIGQKTFSIHIERRYLGQIIWKSQTITILE